MFATTLQDRAERHSVGEAYRRTRRFQVVAGGEALLSSAGGSLLTATAVAVGLDRALSAQLVPWKSARATHDPGKIVLDLAVAIALGVTACQTSRSSGPSRTCSGRSPPTRRCRG